MVSTGRRSSRASPRAGRRRRQRLRVGGEQLVEQVAGERPGAAQQRPHRVAGRRTAGHQCVVHPAQQVPPRERPTRPSSVHHDAARPCARWLESSAAAYPWPVRRSAPRPAGQPGTVSSASRSRAASAAGHWACSAAPAANSAPGPSPAKARAGGASVRSRAASPSGRRRARRPGRHLWHLHPRSLPSSRQRRRRLPNVSACSVRGPSGPRPPLPSPPRSASGTPPRCPARPGTRPGSPRGSRRRR